VQVRLVPRVGRSACGFFLRHSVLRSHRLAPYTQPLAFRSVAVLVSSWGRRRHRDETHS